MQTKRKERRESGRPAKNPDEPIIELVTIRVDPSMREEIDELVGSTGGTVSATLRPILMAGIRRYKFEKDPFSKTAVNNVGVYHDKKD